MSADAQASWTADEPAGSARTVFVTGAAAGIGHAIALAMAERGANVVLADIDGAAARSAASRLPRACAYELDVTDRAAFELALGRAEADVGPIDVLVNNAAVMPLMPFLEVPEATARWVIDVNLLGPIHGMQLALPKMVERGRGHVLNISSVAARWGIPGENVYVATKHALDGLAEVVRAELRGTSVHLTTVYMGPVAGPELSLGMSSRGVIRFSSPSEIASRVVKAVERPRPEQWIPRSLGWAVKSISLCPRPVRDRLFELAGVTAVATAVDQKLRSQYEMRMAQLAATHYADPARD